MLSTAEFLLGALALLATPGPTNTLLATSGAARGMRPSLSLLVGELSGYLLSVAVLTAAVGPLVAARPAFGVGLRMLIAVYVLYLAALLWRQSALRLGDARPVTPSRVFVTTLLNPKAAIFAFALLPPHPSAGMTELLPRVGALSVLIVMAGCGWIAAGAVLKRRLRHPQAGYRAGAVALAVIAAVIGSSTVGLALG